LALYNIATSCVLILPQLAMQITTAVPTTNLPNACRWASDWMLFLSSNQQRQIPEWWCKC